MTGSGTRARTAVSAVMSDPPGESFKHSNANARPAVIQFWKGLKLSIGWSKCCVSRLIGLVPDFARIWAARPGAIKPYCSGSFVGGFVLHSPAPCRLR